MATSTTQIANLALSRVGAMQIASLDTSTSEEARQCRLHFDQKRDQLLRQHQWSFATDRATLSALDAAPITEWAAAWQLPSDLVRLIRISGANRLQPIEDYAIEGRLLLTNEEGPVNIVYVTSAAPVTEWDSLYVDALVCLLAAELAGSIAQSPPMKAELLQEFARLSLPAAVTADARESLSGENHGFRQISARSALLGARFSRGARAAIGTITGGDIADPSAPNLDAIAEEGLP